MSSQYCKCCPLSVGTTVFMEEKDRTKLWVQYMHSVTRTPEREKKGKEQ